MSVSKPAAASLPEPLALGIDLRSGPRYPIGVAVLGIPRKRRPTHDELDAATPALACVLHLQGRTEAINPGAVSPLVAPPV